MDVLDVRILFSFFVGHGMGCGVVIVMSGFSLCICHCMGCSSSFSICIMSRGKVILLVLLLNFRFVLYTVCGIMVSWLMDKDSWSVLFSTCMYQYILFSSSIRFLLYTPRPSL